MKGMPGMGMGMAGTARAEGRTCLAPPAEGPREVNDGFLSALRVGKKPAAAGSGTGAGAGAGAAEGGRGGGFGFGGGWPAASGSPFRRFLPPRVRFLTPAADKMSLI